MAGNIKDKEALQRINFLYQAAHCVLAHNPENVELVRFYCFTQRTISRRLVLRQDPSVKRTICKKCCSLLVPGITATVRQRRCGRKRRATVARCLSCGHSKRLLNNPEHRLWVDQPEAQLENQAQPERKTAAKVAKEPESPVSQSGPPAAGPSAIPTSS
ncbi:ribonuclease P protein subunit p21 [Brienomyrus brachyistius]|uniref:ribonuclease P protein subunit p21 n=1 Tax=Brienomyrus brachyistius TaxID=42636 RepID=UPI0020B2F917|nr:ribonuclease P protein subunit p21 [Brienomyrus brachyistius]